MYSNISTILPVTSTEPSWISIETTAASPPEEIPELWGFITAGIAILFFGSNFVPVKKYETGDGMFFQWIVCSAVMVVGIIVQLIRKQPPFFPIAMIGGVVWELGNVCVVPIVKTIGLGLGICIWGMVNLLSGWSTGRFGFFGLTESVPHNEVMNYIGVGMCVFSAIIFSFVKNEVTPINNIESEPLISQGSSGNIQDMNEDESFIDRMSPGTKRALGLILCLFSGVMYGQMFTGATYIQDHPDKFPGATTNGLDYVFSCFCGIYLTSTTFFCIYIVIMKNKPKIYPKVILPGIASGVMWGIATSCWFVANRSLSIPVAFPIVTAGPSVVASLWGVLVFKEITGKRNLLILMFGFSIAIGGAVLAGVSKN
ncbi:transmembrane protein 144-like isoform X2 [Mytilus galloprovincialis]|uniref:transmembrane protein 144-like isoform X2 n=1 Tax=Mytilus galloprovincialis TaxID=29158 RepID=UPI003F7C78FE